MKRLTLALLIALATPAAAEMPDDTIVYANHYCRPGFARIDVWLTRSYMVTRARSCAEELPCFQAFRLPFGAN